jgi:hypothetical protein
LKYGEFKAPKGVIKVELLLSGDVISRISLSGDFFIYPEEALERLESSLTGVKVDLDNLMAAVKKFYQDTGAQTPLLTPEHWVEAILRAARS